MAKYIENVSFFISHSVNISNKELRASSIFQSDDDQAYIYDIKDDKLIVELNNILAEGKIGNISIDNISLTLSRFGICNLRISCSSNEAINADNFSFDNQLAKVYEELLKFFKEQGIITKDNDKKTLRSNVYKTFVKFLEKIGVITTCADMKTFFERVDPDSRYLYHQHIAESNSKSSIEWSVYKYHSADVPIEYLDLDSMLLERNVLYYVFSRCYISLLNSKKLNNLKTIQELLNINRRTLAEHELLLHELESNYFEKFHDDSPKHRLDESEKLYERLENNIEHLSEQMEDERRHQDSIAIERVFLVLALIGLVSVITGLLALLPGKDNVGCDTNTTDFILSSTYLYALGMPGTIVMIVSGFLFVAGLAWLFFKIIQNSRKNR